LWVTLFDPRQMYASGEWVNLMREREGVEMWSANDRPIVDKDVVLWYTNSVLHSAAPRGLAGDAGAHRGIPSGADRILGNESYGPGEMTTLPSVR
jgi:hypothetical protein